jgi:pyridoxamine 5'-phosphate oxidase
MTLLPDHLVERFNALLARATAAGEPEATALSLATADAAGRPSVRTVLLKQLDRHGFVVYTNTHSDKGRQLAANPQAALCILWKQLDLGVQVRAEGRVEAVTEAEADAYFATRPRGSQLGAWASAQSRPLADRAQLERALADVEARFHGQPVPRPPHWSGYRLLPDRLEFWHGREFRLHDRELFTFADGQWQASRLFP